MRSQNLVSGPPITRSPARRLTGALLAGLLLAAAPAQAQDGGEAGARDPDRFSQPGLYAVLGGSYAIDNFEKGKFDDGGGFDGRFGWRAHPHAAAELELEINGFDFRTADGAGNQINGTVDVMTWTANAKAFALTGRFQPYGLVGLGLLAADVDSVSKQTDVDFAMRFGLGIDVYLTDNLALTAGGTYLLPVGAVSTLDYISVTGGLQYVFRAGPQR